jgi:predicted DNA-binding transcriptional regulator YafY
MNRTDRLLAIVLELQARRYTRAEALAERFEMSVRTIYRDVLALCEAGVPVVATPGRGYMLSPGYFLPPLMLTPDEAGALLLGAAFVAEQVDAPYREAVETARKKVEKLLPEATRQEVEFVLDSLRFVGRAGTADERTSALLAVLRRTILERHVVRLAYHARHGDPGSRDVEPHGLVCIGGRWMLTAYCRTRRDMRNFRLDRIDSAMPLDERFTRRLGFTVRRVPAFVGGPGEARVLFRPEAIRWARENRPLGFVREEPHPGGTVMVVRPRELRDLLPWLLSWGPQARVLEPAALVREVALAAREVAAQYASCEATEADDGARTAPGRGDESLLDPDAVLVGGAGRA